MPYHAFRHLSAITAVRPKPNDVSWAYQIPWWLTPQAPSNVVNLELFWEGGRKVVITVKMATDTSSSEGCRTFRRRFSGSIINVIPPLRDSSSYYSFHSLDLKYFQFVFRLVTRHLAAYIVPACRSPGRADRVSAGPVVSNSEPLSPGRTQGLVCGGAAQWYYSVKVAKYHKYSSDTQINVVKVSLPHTIFWLLRFVKSKPCIRPLNAPVYETSQLVYETSDTKCLAFRLHATRRIHLCIQAYGERS